MQKEPSELPWSQTALFLNSMLRRSLPLRSPVLWSSAQGSCWGRCRPSPAREDMARGQSRSAWRGISARSRAGRSKGDCCTRTSPPSTKAGRECPLRAVFRRSGAWEGSQNKRPARRDDRLVHGLCPRIVGNAGVAQVDRHALNANAICPAVLPDRQHCIGPQLVKLRPQRGTGGVKLRRDLAL